MCICNVVQMIFKKDLSVRAFLAYEALLAFCWRERSLVGVSVWAVQLCSAMLASAGFGEDILIAVSTLFHRRLFFFLLAPDQGYKLDEQEERKTYDASRFISRPDMQAIALRRDRRGSLPVMRKVKTAVMK